MISRIWRGWARGADADAYEALLRSEIFGHILERDLPGFTGIDLLKRTLGDGQVEFLTIMWFDSMEAVMAFAGTDHEAAVVPPRARALLARFDERSAHYQVVERRGPTAE